MRRHSGLALGSVVAFLLVATHLGGAPSLLLQGASDQYVLLEPDSNRIPRSMSSIMGQTVMDRRNRYVARGYGYTKDVSKEIADVMKPIETEMSDMESEIENEQTEIAGLERSRRASSTRSMAEKVPPKFRISIPGSISIDHLKLPAGAYEVSFGNPSQRRASSQLADATGWRESLTQDSFRKRATSDSKVPKLAVSAAVAHLRSKLAALEQKQYQEQSLKPELKVSDQDPLDALVDAQLAASGIQSARRTELAMQGWKAHAVARRSRKHAFLSGVVVGKSPNKHVLHLHNIKQHVTGKARDHKVKRFRQKLHKNMSANMHTAARRRPSVFHHVLQHGAPTSGGAAVASIIGRLVRSETHLTPEERSFAADTMRHPHRDLHTDAPQSRTVKGAARTSRLHETSTVRDLIPRAEHNINMRNVDKLEQVTL